MPTRLRPARWAAIAVAGLSTCMAAHAQNVTANAGGTVLDATGNVMVQRGARTFAAARGTGLQVGDRIYLLDGSTLTMSCPGENAVKVTTVGTFTYSGCQRAALAATPANNTQTAIAQNAGAAGTNPAAPVPTAAPAALPPPSATPTPVVAESGRHSGAGITLGILGGLALLAAAGGGGGGGGGGSTASSSSSSAPVSP